VDAGGGLLPSKAQQVAIKRMRDLQRQGLSLRAIASAVAAEGFVLSHAGVKKVLDGDSRLQKSKGKN
jgi:hypothetical protein